MGFLTTVVIHNDALHNFQEQPKEFAEAIFEGMDRANYEHKNVSVALGSNINYIHVQPSRHADDETVYLHTGNTVFNMNPGNEDFRELAERNPELAQDFIKRAEAILKRCKETVKSIKTMGKP